VGWWKALIKWAVFLAFFVPLIRFILEPIYETLWAQFPAAHVAYLRIFMTLAPWVLVGLLVFYAIQSVRAFREGMREGRRRPAGSQHG